MSKRPHNLMFVYPTGTRCSNNRRIRLILGHSQDIIRLILGHSQDIIRLILGHSQDIIRLILEHSQDIIGISMFSKLMVTQNRPKYSNVWIMSVLGSF